MSYSVCVRSGGLCTGCMACQDSGYDEERREADAIDEVLEWFVSPWECFLAVVKHGASDSSTQEREAEDACL